MKKQAKPYVTMTEAERERCAMAIVGLEMGPRAEERILAEGQVFDFLEALHEHMESDGVTQAELARRVGVKKNQIFRWLSTESDLRASSMFLLARMMGYKVEQSWKRIEVGVALLQVDQSGGDFFVDCMDDGIPQLNGVTRTGDAGFVLVDAVDACEEERHADRVEFALAA